MELLDVMTSDIERNCFYYRYHEGYRATVLLDWSASAHFHDHVKSHDGSPQVRALGHSMEWPSVVAFEAVEDGM